MPKNSEYSLYFQYSGIVEYYLKSSLSISDLK